MAKKEGKAVGEPMPWRVLRDLGFVGIAAAAAVAIVGMVTRAHQPVTTAVIATAPPPAATPPRALALDPPVTPIPPAPAPAAPKQKYDPNWENAPFEPGSVVIYNSGSTEAYSVTVGNRGGVNYITTHHLGDEYQYYEEFLRLLKQRDPQLYAWTLEQRKERAASGNYVPLRQPPGTKVVGQTDYGQEIVEGQTLVVPLKPRSTQEIEKHYKTCYDLTRQAFLEEQQRKEQLARLKKQRAASSGDKPASN